MPPHTQTRTLIQTLTQNLIYALWSMSLGGGVVRRRFQVFTYALDDFKWVQVEM